MEPLPTSAPTRASFHQPALDALRFFAFSTVFFFHNDLPASWARTLHPIGALGVPLFFTLSAYLIMTLLILERERTGTVHLKSFALRRILRIWPLYFFIIAAGWAIGQIWPQWHIGRGAIAALLLLAGNWYIIKHGFQAVGLIGAVWSISLEEQFYLGVPWLVRLGGRRAIMVICLASLPVAWIVDGWLLHVNPASLGIVLNSFIRFQYFGLGGLLALFAHRRTIHLPTLVRAAVFLAGCACYFLATQPLFNTTMPIVVTVLLQNILSLIAITMILISVLHYRGAVPSTLVYLGKISYGLYLFHQPLLILMLAGKFGQSLTFHPYREALFTFILTVACAALSYRYFERPILKLKVRFEFVKTRSA